MVTCRAEQRVQIRDSLRCTYEPERSVRSRLALRRPVPTFYIHPRPQALRWIKNARFSMDDQVTVVEGAIPLIPIMSPLGDYAFISDANENYCFL